MDPWGTQNSGHGSYQGQDGLGGVPNSGYVEQQVRKVRFRPPVMCQLSWQTS
jgi:hypothetical protein